MKKLFLKIDQLLQGSFKPSKLNLLLVFQVNCPGCFIYALPLATQLHHHFKTEINILGLSTAFEDFSLNTIDNTRLLLEKGELVGATKQYFHSQGASKFQLELPFPISFDQLGAGSELFEEADVEHICHLNSQFADWDSETQAQARLRVKHYLQRQPISAYTFTVNQLQGTPSWIIFDAEYTILAEWFGHQPEDQIIALLNRFVEAD
ncbi:MAG: hypothetical protein ACFBSC_19770 [Microcoleaceae cyanobacterium]